MKYNKSEIMKKAWSLYSNDYGTFSACLKRAWAIAKMSDGMKAAVAYYDRYYTNHAYAKMEMTCNPWKKYGKDRTYINAVAYNYAGNVTKTYKVGYVDNISNRFYATR